MIYLMSKNGIQFSSGTADTGELTFHYKINLANLRGGGGGI